MAHLFRSQNPPKIEKGTSRNNQAASPTAPPTFSVEEVTNLLQVTPERLRQWGQAFPLFLDEGAKSNKPLYSQADLATLIVIQKLLEAGHDHEQVMQRLAPHHAALHTTASDTGGSNSAASNPNSAGAPDALSSDTVSSDLASPNTLSPDAESNVTPIHTNHRAAEKPTAREGEPTSAPANPAAEDAAAALPQHPAPLRPPTRQLPASAQSMALNEMVGELLNSVAGSQQSMLNIQDSIREMLGVIVQDNFNLKHENRKLRERMLELERTLAEYQRREETRKERMEGRLRAVESTLSAIQQQVTQLVQFQRQRNRRGWFR